MLASVHSFNSLEKNNPNSPVNSIDPRKQPCTAYMLTPVFTPPLDLPYMLNWRSINTYRLPIQTYTAR